MHDNFSRHAPIVDASHDPTQSGVGFGIGIFLIFLDKGALLNVQIGRLDFALIALVLRFLQFVIVDRVGVDGPIVVQFHGAGPTGSIPIGGGFRVFDDRSGGGNVAVVIFCGRRWCKGFGSGGGQIGGGVTWFDRRHFGFAALVGGRLGLRLGNLLLEQGDSRLQFFGRFAGFGGGCRCSGSCWSRCCDWLGRRRSRCHYWCGCGFGSHGLGYGGNGFGRDGGWLGGRRCFGLVGMFGDSSRCTTAIRGSFQLGLALQQLLLLVLSLGQVLLERLNVVVGCGLFQLDVEMINRRLGLFQPQLDRH
mmetsp:Transcript_15965/g.43960  ORF Transcript_15965/g.43960 Transcript_15965/m.43960 type:complete len:305 (+) Transcript_15965:602-1516(+)